MSSVAVNPIPCLTDNYSWIITDVTGSRCLVIDPGESFLVANYVQEHNLKVEGILLTHHHWDHVSGCLELSALTGAWIAGPEAERERLPACHRYLREGDTVDLPGVELRVMETPGHTAGHISFYAANSKHPAAEETGDPAGTASTSANAEEPTSWLFSGDVLFSLGCGRCLECSPAIMWSSLERLLSLPAATLLCCGHEYTKRNGEFALNIEPENRALQDRYNQAKISTCTLPVALGQEFLTNPFLRVAVPAIREKLRMPAASHADLFTELRRRKDIF